MENMPDRQEDVYREFTNYDWASFKEFQEGLTEILSRHLESMKERDPSIKAIPASEKQQLTDQAKSFFFCSSTGHILNLDDYYVWKRNNGDKLTILEAKDQSPEVSAENSPETPYSSNYQQLVELIVTGKPVPGIKQIPDTVLAGQQSESRAEQRLKPWEIDTHRQNKPDISEMTTS